MSDQPKYNSKVAAAADWCLGCVCLIIVSCPVATMFTFQAYTSKRRARDHEKLLKGKVDRREPTSYRERYELGLELLDPREWQRRRESYRKPRRPWGHEESGFAKLPPELRMKIYEMAYGFCGIHVSKYKSEDRNWGIPCKHDPSDGKWCFHNCVAGTRRDYYRRQGCVGRHVTEWIPPDPGIGLLNLMLVCRFMYIDIETFVYKRKPFFFLSPRDFLLFRHNLAPHLFDKLTHVSIDFRHDQSERYSLDLKPGNQDTIDEDVKELLGEHFTEYENVSVWAATCIAISRMPSLKNVNIRLRAAVFCRVLQASADFRENEYSENDDPVWQVKASEKPIMEPLQVAGRALKDANISVEVDWPIPPGDQDWSGGNLALKRWHRCSTCGLICDLSANRHDTGHCAAHFVVGPRSVWAANYLHTPAARFSND